LKENPNDESRFLMENPTRSDFFLAMVTIAFVYVVASSCWLESKAKTHRPPAESEALHGNQQRW